LGNNRDVPQALPESMELNIEILIAHLTETQKCDAYNRRQRGNSENLSKCFNMVDFSMLSWQSELIATDGERFAKRKFFGRKRVTPGIESRTTLLRIVCSRYRAAIVIQVQKSARNHCC